MASGSSGLLGGGLGPGGVMGSLGGMSSVLSGLGGAGGKGGLGAASDDVAGLQHLLEAAQRQQDGAESGTKREVPGAGGEPNAKRFCAGAGATQPQA